MSFASISVTNKKASVGKANFFKDFWEENHVENYDEINCRAYGCGAGVW